MGAEEMGHGAVGVEGVAERGGVRGEPCKERVERGRRETIRIGID